LPKQVRVALAPFTERSRPNAGQGLDIVRENRGPSDERANIMPGPEKLRHEFAADAHGFSRVNVARQFTSHDLPPSAENACSKRKDVGVMSENTKRTRIACPSTES
jgi:hypothetical protein